MEFAVIGFYAVILGLVAPYIHARSEEYGALLAPSVALATGAISWAALTWLGFSYKEGYIWVICMVLMPLAMIVVSGRVAAARVRAREKNLRG
jgi:ABC-type transport system involved in cytochrome bd biosynthesis fused ATPase/permease subunit